MNTEKAEIKSREKDIMTDNPLSVQPKVSVIIPVYNVKPYLEEALDSVINQTHKNLEILLIDDGSNDGSENMCDEYAKKDDRIKVIHQKNAGLSGARNTGLDNMSGDYVAFLDSDDAMHPQMVEKTLQIILKEDVDYVVFNYLTCETERKIKFDKQKIRKKKSRLKEGVYSQKEALKAAGDWKINVTSWCKLYKKRLWDNIRYPIGHVHEDIDVIFKLISAAEKIYVSDYVLIAYRKHKKSITNTISLDNFNDWYNVHKEFSDFISANIPLLFTEKQLIYTKIRVFNFLVSRFIWNYSASADNKQQIDNQLKEYLKEVYSEIQKEACAFDIKIAYFLVFHCPYIIALIYPIYIKIRKLLLK